MDIHSPTHPKRELLFFGSQSAFVTAATTYSACIGSFVTSGMVIALSMGTAGRIAEVSATDLTTRAADVC
jgi:3-polyprenyl-4-hydroxybenzoate decarboxylase